MAVQSQRDIRRRIRSVKSTQQITRAMELVSAAKLRRAQVRAREGEPFASKLQETLIRLTPTLTASLQYPLLQRRDLRRVSYLVVTGDRGLAGGYNANVIRLATEVLEQEEYPCDLWVMGRKGSELFCARHYTLHRSYADLGDDVDWEDARRIAGDFVEAYTDGRTDAVFVIYTEFVNTLVHRPVVRQLLPLEYPENEQALHTTNSYILEPSPAAVLELLLPRYLESLVFRALLGAKTSEHAARMTAMRSATDNAQKMIDELTLSLNRARQAGITREITEIVGGANALAGAGNGGTAIEYE